MIPPIVPVSLYMVSLLAVIVILNYIAFVMEVGVAGSFVIGLVRLSPLISSFSTSSLLAVTPSGRSSVLWQFVWAQLCSILAV